MVAWSGRQVIQREPSVFSTVECQGKARRLEQSEEVFEIWKRLPGRHATAYVIKQTKICGTVNWSL